MPEEPINGTGGLVAGRLLMAWPQPRLSVNTPDKLELAMGEVAAGLKSHLMLIQDWYGVGREEAIEICKQIAKDQAELEKVNPEIAAARAIPPGERERYDQRNEDQASEPDDDDE